VLLPCVFHVDAPEPRAPTQQPTSQAYSLCRLVDSTSFPILSLCSMYDEVPMSSSRHKRPGTKPPETWGEDEDDNSVIGRPVVYRVKRWCRSRCKDPTNGWRVRIKRWWRSRCKDPINGWRVRVIGFKITSRKVILCSVLFIFLCWHIRTIIATNRETTFNGFAMSNGLSKDPEPSMNLSIDLASS